MFQTVWFMVRGFAGFVLGFVRDVTRTSVKPKFVSGVKPSSLKHVWLNVNITTEAPKCTDVIKRHVNKD